MNTAVLATVGEVRPDAADAAASACDRAPWKRLISAAWEVGGRLQLGLLGISYPADERPSPRSR